MAQKKIPYILLLSSILLGLNRPVLANESVSLLSNLDVYAKYFYNRYSKNFDSFGLQYSSPTYGVSQFKKPETAREWLALASYYKYRALNNDPGAKQILKQAIFSAYQEMAVNSSYKGFAAAEANFLAIRLLETNSSLINPAIKKDILIFLSNRLKEAVKESERENRQFIAAAHWQYINNYLFENLLINQEEKEKIDNILKGLVDEEISACINPDYWYFENEMTSFTPHYHAISAFMLLVYGHLTDQIPYIGLAEKMYYNLKKISFINGFVEADLGHRPIGHGAQFYLSLALMGSYFNDPDYQVYLFYASGHRFFSDKKHPDRLEFHSTLENSLPKYHDDYAFSDIVELGLIIPSLRKINLSYKLFFENPLKKSADKTFKIENTGKVIIVNNQKNVLGSYGNWSHLYSLK